MTALRARLADPTVRRWLIIGALAVVLLLALYAPFYFAPFRVFQLNRAMIFATAILGLGLLTGYNGQISLGHGAFFAIGAYTAAILIVQLSWPWWIVVVPAMALTFLLGYAVGIPALRLEGLYLALVTLALAVVTPPVLKRFSGLTGGSMGLTVPTPEPPAWTGLAQDQYLYLIALVVLVVVLVLARNLVRSRPGRAMVAIRERPLAAETMGVDVAHVKTMAFAWSAMFAGLAGVMFTWTIGYVSPDSFALVLSIELLAALVVGGLGSIAGAVLGGLFLVFVPDLAEDVNEAAPGIAFGGALVLAMYVFPGGIAGVARSGWHRLAARQEVPEDGPRGRTSGAGSTAETTGTAAPAAGTDGAGP